MFVGSKRTGGLARLGEILLEAGLIKPEIVTQSLAIAKNARLPIGRVLVMSGHLSDKVIENAVEAQSGIRSGKFTREYAVKLMRVANSQNVSIEQASALVAWDRTLATNFGELGKFLLAAELVDEDKLWAAHTRSKQEGTTLGPQLVKDEIFAARTLMDVLQVVVFFRQELIPRAEAVLIVQKLHTECLPLEQACAAHGFDTLFYPPRIRLADLLVNANLLDEIAALDAVETSLEQKRMVGEILIERNQLDLGILEAALNLQEMVHAELLLANYVGEVLELVKCLERPLDEVLSDLEEMNSTARFINVAGLLNDEDKSQLYEQYEVNRLNIGKVLFASGMLSDETIRLACACVKLMEAGIVDEAGAVAAIHYSLEHNVPPEEALVQLSIAPPLSAATEQAVEMSEHMLEQFSEMTEQSSELPEQFSEMSEHASELPEQVVFSPDPDNASQAAVAADTIEAPESPDAVQPMEAVDVSETPSDYAASAEIFKSLDQALGGMEQWDEATKSSDASMAQELPGDEEGQHSELATSQLHHTEPDETAVQEASEPASSEAEQPVALESTEPSSSDVEELAKLEASTLEVSDPPACESEQSFAVEAIELSDSLTEGSTALEPPEASSNDAEPPTALETSQPDSEAAQPPEISDSGDQHLVEMSVPVDGVQKHLLSSDRIASLDDEEDRAPHIMGMSVEQEFDLATSSLFDSSDSIALSGIIALDADQQEPADSTAAASQPSELQTADARTEKAQSSDPVEESQEASALIEEMRVASGGGEENNNGAVEPAASADASDVDRNQEPLLVDGNGSAPTDESASTIAAAESNENSPVAAPKSLAESFLRVSTRKNDGSPPQKEQRSFTKKNKKRR